MLQYNADYLVDPGERIFYTMASVTYHAYARNNLVDRMQGDWLLMLDTDHTFEPDLAARLLHIATLHQIDVLTGLYCSRQPPYNPVLMTRQGDHVQWLGDWDRHPEHPTLIMPVGSAGAGCLFVRRRVFDRIRTELGENPFEIRKCFSEDNSFFDRLHQLGIPAYCCPAIEAPHVRTQPVRLADYQPDPALIGPRIPVESLA
jgi:GT2 family glycosyltransferase